MKPVIPEFILGPQENKKADGHPNREPHDVDDRMERVFADISQGHYEIIFEHRHPPVKCCIQESRKGSENFFPDPDFRFEPAFGLGYVGVHVCEIAIQIDIVLLGQDVPQQP